MLNANAWLPIESAPKDGTKILGWGSFMDPKIYGTEYNLCWVIQWNDSSTEQLEDAGNGLFRKTVKLVGSWTLSNFHATHWMPLPGAPTTEPADEPDAEESDEPTKRCSHCGVEGCTSCDEQEAEGERDAAGGL